MNWRPIDFQGIIDLDHQIVDQLDHYLQEKETRLASQILNVIESPPAENSPPHLPEFPLKLSEGVEGFSKRVRLVMKDQESLSFVETDRVVKELNGALWEFTEVLEGCISELFQQVRQVPISRWHISIFHVVHAIKDMLVHRIEDLIWAIRRLEKPLKEYCQKFRKTTCKWDYWRNMWKGVLDPELIRNLQQSERFLKTRYEEFNQHYAIYTHLSVKVEDYLQKMKSYPVLALLDMPDQNLYIDIFRLLKMLEFNRHPKKEVAKNTMQAIKYLASIDHVIKMFRTYYQELEEAFFNSSLEWKSLNQSEANFKEALQKLQGKVQDYQHELQQLKHTMSHYRLFMLKTDANPYIRSRWGFTEWIVGPEPVKAKKLLHLLYSTEELEHYLSDFTVALGRDTSIQLQREKAAQQEIQKLLHEMGQPLISRSMMRSRAMKLLEQLLICDEVGSPHVAMIDWVGDVLNKAMREDWKYQVLHEIPLFHQVYRLHQGLSEYMEDPAHAFRLDHFHHLFDQIEDWVDKEDIYAHVHEIEVDMNDMKTYLQDFFAVIQRTVKGKSQDPFLDETTHKFRQQLLEYRYIFGQFFFTIMTRNADGQQLRQQFLFVDQYFESIENLLNELRMSWEKNPRTGGKPFIE
jgi:hypothetical protein